MTYILLPIHPEWVCLFLNGTKKIEVRSGTRLYNAINRLIKEQGKAPCLMYCTQGNGCITSGYNHSGKTYVYFPKGHSSFSGKVIAEFEASAEIIKRTKFSIRYTETLHADELSECSCLNQTEMSNYLGIGEGTAIHVHNLKIFDEPKELKEFHYPCKHKELSCEECVKLRIEGSLKDKPSCHFGTGIEKAPQSWCYAEVEE